MKRWLASTLKAQPRAEPAPTHWLAWNPTAWVAPLKRTLPPRAPPIQTSTLISPGADALLLELPPTGALVVGRDDGCAITFNDATLASRHVVLHSEAGGWAIEALPTANGTCVDGVLLEPGRHQPLQDGARLELGQLTLTFLTTESLWASLTT